MPSASRLRQAIDRFPWSLAKLNPNVTVRRISVEKTAPGGSGPLPLRYGGAMNRSHNSPTLTGILLIAFTVL